MNDVLLEDITQYYGAVIAAEAVDLHVDEGELFALLGPSGSGKTTLLRLIAGFMEPTRGRIRIGGRDMRGLPPHKRDVGVVFQNYALFPHLSVAENVGFGLSVRRLAKAEVERRVSEALALVQLEGLGARKPSQLSGGQQQRVALARALVIQPKVFLLDEPLGALDRKLRAQMQVELRQLQRKVGVTTLLVTHDQEEALTLADRVAVLRGGRVQQVGRPEDVYEHPANPFVADFLGQANLFEGVAVEVTGGIARVRTGDGRLLSGMAAPAVRTGMPAVLMVRPERLSLSRVECEDGLCGRVIQRLYAGAVETYVVELADGRRLSAAMTNVEAGSAVQEGQLARIGWQPQQAWVMAGESSVS